MTPISASVSHMAFSRVACLLSLCSHLLEGCLLKIDLQKKKQNQKKRTPIIASGPSPTLYDLILTWLYLQRPYFEISSQSQILGVRAYTCLFFMGVHNSSRYKNIPKTPDWHLRPEWTIFLPGKSNLPPALTLPTRTPPTSGDCMYQGYGASCWLPPVFRNCRRVHSSRPFF